jgi:hypothetical protein
MNHIDDSHQMGWNYRKCQCLWKGVPIAHIPNEEIILVILPLFGHEITKDI